MMALIKTKTYAIATAAVFLTSIYFIYNHFYGDATRPTSTSFSRIPTVTPVDLSLPHDIIMYVEAIEKRSYHVGFKFDYVKGGLETALQLVGKGMRSPSDPEAGLLIPVTINVYSCGAECTTPYVSSIRETSGAEFHGFYDNIPGHGYYMRKLDAFVLPAGKYKIVIRAHSGINIPAGISVESAVYYDQRATTIN
jgi:hypothetical protein